MTEKTTCVIVGGGPAGIIHEAAARARRTWTSPYWKNTTSSRLPRRPHASLDALRLLDGLGLFKQFDALPRTKLTR